MTATGLLPRGMVGRIAIVLFAALLLELLGNVALHRMQDRELISAAETRDLADRLMSAQRIATTAPRDARARLLHDMAAPGMALNWVPRTVIIDFSASLDRLNDMRSRIVRAAPTLADRPMRLTILPSANAGQRDLVGAMQLADGSFVTFRVSPYLAAPPSPVVTTLLHLLLMTVVLVAALLMVRALIRPLQELAHAADATGGRYAIEIPLEGPHEVRRVATAFAAMQARLLKMVDDHTRAMVAVSHDLRTPIQRMRLRAALADGGETRDLMTQDLMEMEHFIDSTLAYVRDDQEEAQRFVDVAAIVITAVDNAADAGAEIDYYGPDALSVTTRPIAVKRVLGNLIDNATRHAGRITVFLESDREGFRITVDDDGPGIPPDQRGAMLLPFRRLNTSGDARGGAGLGLAISDKVVSQLGGTLTLGKATLGGLRVEVCL